MSSISDIDKEFKMADFIRWAKSSLTVDDADSITTRYSISYNRPLSKLI